MVLRCIALIYDPPPRLCIEPVTFAHCSFIFALQNIALGGYLGHKYLEHGSFTPQVFSATEGMAPAVTTAYKRLASLLADKRKQEYSKTICWLLCAISFSLVRSAVMCLRGARSSLHRPSRTVDCEVPLDMAIGEGRIPSY